MRMVILGDIGASSTNQELFCAGKTDLVSTQIQELCNEADDVLLNLEKPLTDKLTPLDKCPPDYIAPTQSINGIKLLHPTIISLANNHILDQQKQGLLSTINVLEKNGITYVGAGNNSHNARKPVIFKKTGINVGVYACCEKEFSFATDNKPGANVFDPLESFDDIEQLKNTCDYVVVLYHGGMQSYPYPTPYQQKVCRKMCMKGADLVVCQHSHIIGCKEIYNKSQIIYGQGNFLLDEKDDETWREGLIIQIDINKSQVDMQLIPVQTVQHRVILHQEADSVMDKFIKRSEEIEDQGFVLKAYDAICEQKLPAYMVKLSGASVFLQKIIARLKLNKVYYNLKYQRIARNRVLNYLYCDTHREAIERGIELNNSRKSITNQS